MAGVPGSTTESARWVDIISPPDALFFKGLLDGMDDAETTVTVREKGATAALTRATGLEYDVIGKDFDDPLTRKFGIPLRTAQLALQAPDCDVSLSFRNAMCILASKARRVPSIHFTDNDITAHRDGLYFEELYNALESMADHVIVPSAFATETLTKYAADSGTVHTFDGYKEDIAVASFSPNPSFTEALPFSEYVVVRPEALTAAYVDAETIVPDLLAGIVESGMNAVYLPRGRGDEGYGRQYKDVYVPEKPLHGLQLAWHADCVLTGSGTMAREAACMGKPAVSFFPNALLSVDHELVAEGRVFHSRDHRAIVEYLRGLDDGDSAPDTEHCERVRDEVATLTDELVREVT